MEKHREAQKELKCVFVDLEKMVNGKWVVHDIYEDNKTVENRQVQSTVGITSGIDSEPPQVGVFMEYDVHTVYWE